MPTRLTDTRDMTADQADQVLREIFRRRLDILRAEAQAEARINAIRTGLTNVTAADRAALEAAEARLDSYIHAHEELFVKPRMRVTPWGTYGLRSSTRTVIDSREEAIAYAKKKGYTDMVQVTEALVTKAVAKRLAAGEAIPGVRRETGEAAEYKLDTAALQAEL